MGCGCSIKWVDEPFERMERHGFGEDDDGNTIWVDIPVTGFTLRAIIDDSRCIAKSVAEGKE